MALVQFIKAKDEVSVVVRAHSTIAGVDTDSCPPREDRVRTLYCIARATAVVVENVAGPSPLVSHVPLFGLLMKQLQLVVWIRDATDQKPLVSREVVTSQTS